MRVRRPLPPPLTGHGRLVLGRERVDVAFTFHAAAYRGSLTGPPENMAEAFRRGEGLLELTGGEPQRLIFTAYSAGGDTVYFETPKPPLAGLGMVGSSTLPGAPRRAQPNS